MTPTNGITVYPVTDHAFVPVGFDETITA